MARTLESTDAKIVAMIRGLSGTLAYDLITTFDIEEPTQLDDDSLHEALVGAYLDGDIAGNIIAAAWEEDARKSVAPIRNYDAKAK